MSILNGEARITYFNISNKTVNSITILVDCNGLGELEISQIKDSNNISMRYGTFQTEKVSPPLRNKMLKSLYLNAPLNPDESINFSLHFAIHNMNRDEGLLMLVDDLIGSGTCWYPRIVSLEGREWKSLKPDAPNYKVALKIPSEVVLIASGKEKSQNFSNGSVSYSFREDKMRGFSLIAAEGLQTISGEVDEVEIKSYFIKEEKPWGVKMASLAHEAIDFYLRRFGFFPYKRISLVAALPVDAEGLSLDGIVLLPRSFTEMVQKLGFNFSLNYSRWLVAHLISEQYWGLYITEIAAYPQWITAAFSLYSDREFLHSLNLSSSIYYNYIEYYLEASQRGIDTSLMQPIGSLANKGYDWQNILARGKGLVIINMLQYLLGKDKMAGIAKEVLEKFSYSVINSEEFIKICQSVSNEPLDWFFHQWLNTSNTLDYELGEVNSISSKNKVTSRIEVFRRGEAQMPLPIEVTLSNGEKILQRIKGVKEREIIVVTNDHPVYRVELDPEQLFPDINYANNYKVVTTAVDREPLFPLDNFFEIGELIFDKEFHPEGIFFRDDFQLKIKNKLNITQGLGIVILVQKAGWRRMGKRSLFVSLSPNETKLIQDYYLLPEIKGKIKIIASFFKASSAQEFKNIASKKSAELTNGYILYLK